MQSELLIPQVRTSWVVVVVVGGLGGAGGLRDEMPVEVDCPTPPPLGQTVSLPSVPTSAKPPDPSAAKGSPTKPIWILSLTYSPV